MKWSDKRFMMWFRSFSTVSLFTLRAAGGSPKGATRDERGTEWDEWRPKERLDVAAVRDRRDEGVRDAVTRERHEERDTPWARKRVRSGSLSWPGSADYLRRRAVFLASSHVSARFPATVASRKRGHEEARRDGADEGACETVARHGEKTSGRDSEPKVRWTDNMSDTRNRGLTEANGRILMFAVSMSPLVSLVCLTPVLDKLWCKDLKRMILEPVWLNNKDISKENV